MRTSTPPRSVTATPAVSRTSCATSMRPRARSHQSVIEFESEDLDKGISAEVAMQWNQGFGESVYTFANTINTTEGGAHEEGYRSPLTSLMNKFARDWGILKDKDTNLTGEDIREGLTAIVSVKLREPQFEGQTKTKLGNTEAKTFVQRLVNDQLGSGSRRTPPKARKSPARRCRRPWRGWPPARHATWPATAKACSAVGAAGKLIDCSSTNPEECELFIVEGDSAGGSARSGRDPATQAILPIRGKILNVEKARLDRVLANNEVQAMISALGTGVQEEFDLNKLRYHKLVLMADADVDGQHIRTLLLTLLFRFMRPLIIEGHVYFGAAAAVPAQVERQGGPRVRLQRPRTGCVGGGRAGGREEEPQEGFIQRFKGLGEMNANELWETTMDPDRRILLQVTLEDAAQADEVFSMLMGEDVESRRKFIQRNAKDVRFLDI